MHWFLAILPKIKAKNGLSLWQVLKLNISRNRTIWQDFFAYLNQVCYVYSKLFVKGNFWLNFKQTFFYYLLLFINLLEDLFHYLGFLHCPEKILRISCIYYIFHHFKIKLRLHYFYYYYLSLTASYAPGAGVTYFLAS